MAYTNYNWGSDVYNAVNAVLGNNTSSNNFTDYLTDSGVVNNDQNQSQQTNNNQQQSNGGVKVDESGDLQFILPRYGYAQYINDLQAWQKQFRDINGHIGWFYFKLFFNFKTEYGLLGSVLKDGPAQIESVNTAIGYLKSIEKTYSYCKISDRILSLCKFVNVLKHISLDVPWFFKGINGLSDIPYPYTEEFQKERKLTITCSEEATDMRIGTLIDLYKYACFDNINCKEIIPSNLRKFEMSLIIMHVPLKFHHEPTIFSDGAESSGKGLIIDNDFSRLASFKMFTFQNCEIDLQGIGSYYGDQVSNESPFSMGKNQISIKYDRVFEHRMNEWNEFMLGDDGFYYNNEVPSELDGDRKFLINSQNNDSEHRKILDMLRKHHGNTNEFLVSYSEIFLDNVYGATRQESGYFGDLLNSLKMHNRNITNAFNNTRNAFGNLANTWNRWSSKKNSENP